MFFASLLFSSLAFAQPVYETVVEGEAQKSEDSVVLDPVSPPKDLAQVLNAEPGVQIQSQGQNQFQSFLLHGSSSEDLLVVIDDIVMNDPTAPSMGFDFSLLDPSLIESVKLWPHSRGVRWGRGAVSGVLEIKLKKKVPAQAGLRGGSDESISGRVQSEQVALSAKSAGGPSAAYSPNSSLENDASSMVSGVMRGTGFDGRMDWSLWGIASRRENDRLSEAVGDDENAWAQNQNLVLKMKTGIAQLSYYDLWRKDHNDSDPVDAYFLRGLAKSRKAQLKVEDIGPRGFWWQGEVTTEWSQVLSADSFGSSRFEGTQNAGSIAILRDEGVLRPGLRLTCLGRCDVLPEISLNVSRVLDWELRASQGLKPPSSFQKFSQYGNRDLRSEKRTSLSARVSKPERERGWAIEGYWNHASQLIDFDIPTNKYFNRKTANMRGASLEVWRQAEKNITHLSYEFLEASDGETGKWLVRRARHNIGARYTRIFSHDWSATVDAKHLSERPDVDSAGTAVQQPSQSLWNLTAKWQKNPGNVFTFSIFNLTDDESSFIYGYGSGGRLFEVGWDHSF